MGASKGVRILAAFTLAYAIVFGALFYWFYAFTRDNAVARLRQDLRAVATGAAQGIDTRELLALYRDGERDARGFSADPRYRHQLEWFETVHELDPNVWPYTFVRGNRADTRRAGDAIPDVEFIYLTDLSAYTEPDGQPRYDPDKAVHFLEPDRGSPAALEAWERGQLAERPGIYTDRFGTWMTDYAPLKDARGQVVAVLGVDYDAAYVEGVVGSVRRQMVLIFSVAYALLAVLGFYVYRARSLRDLFGRYASLSLLRDVALLELGYASRRRVTVMFADINDFSTICERHPPDVVIRMLNAYFATVNDIIVASGGWIKQFVGDEIMVIYNAPDDHPRPEQAAVEAALAIVKKLRELEATAAEPGFFAVKIGIHTGDVIVGNVGSRHRTEYAAVGDDVNVGSRIMTMSKDLGSPVLISAAVYDKVKDMAIELVDRGMHPVKGRRTKVQVYAVRALAEAASAARE